MKISIVFPSKIICNETLSLTHLYELNKTVYQKIRTPPRGTEKVVVQALSENDSFVEAAGKVSRFSLARQIQRLAGLYLKLHVQMLVCQDYTVITRLTEGLFSFQNSSL